MITILIILLIITLWSYFGSQEEKKEYEIEVDNLIRENERLQYQIEKLTRKQ